MPLTTDMAVKSKESVLLLCTLDISPQNMQLCVQVSLNQQLLVKQVSSKIFKTLTQTEGSEGGGILNKLYNLGFLLSIGKRTNTGTLVIAAPPGTHNNQLKNFNYKCRK